MANVVVAFIFVLRKKIFLFNFPIDSIREFQTAAVV